MKKIDNTQLQKYAALVYLVEGYKVSAGMALWELNLYHPLRVRGSTKRSVR